MASLHKDPKERSQFWYCAYSSGTGADRKRYFKSTKTTNKRAAWEICRAWEQATRVGETGKLTPETAREIVARGVAWMKRPAVGFSRPLGNA